MGPRPMKRTLSYPGQQCSFHRLQFIFGRFPLFFGLFTAVFRDSLVCIEYMQELLRIMQIVCCVRVSY
jgi:hypothetical protein